MGVRARRTVSKRGVIRGRSDGSFPCKACPECLILARLAPGGLLPWAGTCPQTRWGGDASDGASNLGAPPCTHRCRIFHPWETDGWEPREIRENAIRFQEQRPVGGEALGDVPAAAPHPPGGLVSCLLCICDRTLSPPHVPALGCFHCKLRHIWVFRYSDCPLWRGALIPRTCKKWAAFEGRAGEGGCEGEPC